MLSKCTYCERAIADGGDTYYDDGDPYCNETCFDEAQVERAEAPCEVVIDFHMVNRLLTMKQPIDIPGCAGVVVPVFLNRPMVDLYIEGLEEPDGYTATPWEITQ